MTISLISDNHAAFVGYQTKIRARLNPFAPHLDSLFSQETMPEWSEGSEHQGSLQGKVNGLRVRLRVRVRDFRVESANFEALCPSVPRTR